MAARASATKPADEKTRGTIQPFKDAKGRKYWRARITYPDGERLWVGPRFYSELRAREYADEKSREAADRKVTVAKVAPVGKADGETCDVWHERYLAFCTEQGLTTVQNKRYRWSKWISPTIGHKAMVAVTRDDIEDVRDRLDDVVRAYQRDGAGKGRLSPKTAQNAWSELTVAFGEASSSKRRDLRIVSADPTTGVQPPERGATKSKVYPYPSEALAVFACEEIPLAWRELHVLSVYTYARPGELRVLTWDDVDLADQKIHVTKAWDYEGEKEKATKTEETRSIPIEPNLLPLLAVMHKRTGGKGLVVPALSTADDNKLAIIMRKHFELAGCVRGRLTVRNTRELRLRFRSWRDAGCTWAIVRGDDVVKVQRRAGHKLIATTMKYVVEAENTGATFGTPFPPLPACLLDASKRASKETGSTADQAEKPVNDGCRRRESNPRPSAYETPALTN